MRNLILCKYQEMPSVATWVPAFPLLSSLQAATDYRSTNLFLTPRCCKALQRKEKLIQNTSKNHSTRIKLQRTKGEPSMKLFLVKTLNNVQVTVLGKKKKVNASSIAVRQNTWQHLVLWYNLPNKFQCWTGYFLQLEAKTAVHASMLLHFYAVFFVKCSFLSSCRPLSPESPHARKPVHYFKLSSTNKAFKMNRNLNIKQKAQSTEHWKYSVLSALSNLWVLTLTPVFSVEIAIWSKIVIQQHVINQSWNFRA